MTAVVGRCSVVVDVSTICCVVVGSVVVDVSTVCCVNVVVSTGC